MFSSGFSVSKVKPQLKMAAQRITLVINKKTAVNKSKKKEIAKLLAEGKEEKASIKVEHVIREDFIVEAYEILQLLCEMVVERLGLIASEKTCPLDMNESLSTLIYATDRTEIPELKKVREQLTKKYGREFASRARQGENVNSRVEHKLSVQPPSKFLVIQYLKEIATTYKVDWAPDESTAIAEQEMLRTGTGALAYPQAAPTGYSVQPTGAHLQQPAGGVPSMPTGMGGPGGGAGGAGGGGGAMVQPVFPQQGGGYAMPQQQMPQQMPYGQQPQQPQFQQPQQPQFQQPQQPQQQQFQQPQQPQFQQPQQPQFQQPQQPQQPATYIPMPPTTQPGAGMPPAAPTGPPTASSAPPPEAKSDIPDFDELTARFNKLKKRD